MRAVTTAIAGAGALAALACLYLFPPDRYGFYPHCWFHDATGLVCPGCGATRALSAMLHGHLQTAIGLNALVVLLLPLILAYGVAALRQKRWPRLPVPLTGALIAAAILFSIYRNLA